MNKVCYDLIYLAACCVNRVRPVGKCLEELDLDSLYRMSCAHFLAAPIGMTLSQSNIALPKEWNETIMKSVRKTILFDAERTKLFAFMEQKGIWYMR